MTWLRYGIPDDHIITMMVDDIAQNRENPFPGQMFNQDGANPANVSHTPHTQAPFLSLPNAAFIVHFPRPARCMQGARKTTRDK